MMVANAAFVSPNSRRISAAIETSPWTAISRFLLHCSHNPSKKIGIFELDD
jgi:hypothetical protein